MHGKFIRILMHLIIIINAPMEELHAVDVVPAIVVNMAMIMRLSQWAETGLVIILVKERCLPVLTNPLRVIMTKV